MTTQTQTRKEKQMSTTIQFERLVSEDEITLYGIHSIVNAVFEKLGFEKRIPPQMMYNYAKNGLIKKNANGKVDREIAIAFLERYITKQLSSGSRVNVKSNVESAFVNN